MRLDCRTARELLGDESVQSISRRYFVSNGFDGALLTMREAAGAGVALGCAVLFAFGAYLGSLSAQRPAVAGLRMALAGVAVAGVNLLIPGRLIGRRVRSRQGTPGRGAPARGG